MRGFSTRFFVIRRAIALLFDVAVLSLMGALFEWAGLSPRITTNLSGCVAFGYFVWFTSRRGGTPGKLLMRVEVRAKEGGFLSFGRASLRAVPQAIGSVALEVGNLIYGVGEVARRGYFEMLWTRTLGWIVVIGMLSDLTAFLYSSWARKYGGTWHDVFARSVVIGKAFRGGA